MIELTQIDDTSNKTYYITNSDGTVITITMIYLETQQFWIMNVSSPTFTLNGVRVCNGLNILKQYINQINFGIACVSNDLQDPFLLNDFLTKRSRLYLLNSAEIQWVNSAFNTQ